MLISLNKRADVIENSSAWPFLAAIFREIPAKVSWAMVTMIALSLTEGLGLLMLVPLLHLVGLDVQQSTLGGVVRHLSSVFHALGMRPTLEAVLGVFVLVTGLRALIERAQTTANLAIQHDFVVLLRQRLYRTISYASWLFFSRSRASQFSHVLTHEVERVGAATHHLLHLLSASVVATVYIVIALRLSILMTALVFACGAALVMLLRPKTETARIAGEGTSEAMEGLYAAISEHVGGMKTVKSYGAEERHLRIFARLTERVHGKYFQAVQNQAQVKCWFDVGSVLILSLMIYVSIEAFMRPTGEVLLLLYLFVKIMPRLSGILQSYQCLINLLPAFASVTRMQSQSEAAAEPRAEGAAGTKLQHAIRLARVTFRYDDVPVIRGLDLTIRAGETVAIVGPSGAGKSTMADLIMGLILPDEGEVLVDDKPLGPGRRRSWREQIGYVAQDTFLFHDTIRANLLWARPNATNEEIWVALRLAAAEGFVAGLPKGLDTSVGDRGMRLSGGETQRLALARALLRRPSVLILDEATSNLDSANEQRIVDALGKMHGSMTILIISHRLSTVRGSDAIYALEKGQLVGPEAWHTLRLKEEGRSRPVEPSMAPGARAEKSLEESASP